MKKNVLHKVLAAAMVSAMAMGTLAGCGNAGDNSSAGTTDAGSTDAGSTDAGSTDAGSADSGAETPAVAGIDGFEPFAERVTLQIPVYDRGDAGNGASDVENNYWTQWVQDNFGEKYNIDVEYIGITRSDVMTDYTLLATGNDLPTILMEYDYDKLATWQSEGYLQPYDMEQLKTIAPTFYQNMVDNGIDIYTQLDGEDYLCLGMRPYGNTNYTWVTWYRQDWLDQLGLSYPKTASERLDLYRKLKEEGICEYPAGGTKVAGAGADQNYGWRDYPQDELTWATTGDYQVPALSTEAQKRLLKYENTLYNEGLKNPEYYTRDGSEANTDFINGEVFEWSAYTSSTVDVLVSFYEANPNAKLGVAVNDGNLVVDEEWGANNSFRPTNVFGTMTAFAHDATPDEVKAAMMYMEWMSQDDVLFTMTWGLEGVNFNYDENGTPVAVGDQTGLAEQQGHNNNVDYWMIVTAAKSFGDIEADVAAIAPQGLPQDFTADILANYEGQNKMYNDGNANADCNFGTAFESVNEYGTILKEEKYPEYRDQLTMCKPEEFDALYDKLSQQYLDEGYQAIIDERKEAYEAGLSTKLPQ